MYRNIIKTLLYSFLWLSYINFLSAKLIEVRSEAEFDKYLQNSEKPKVIDFGASWCGPCKELKPRIAQLSDEHSEILFLSVDGSDFPKLVKLYRVKNYPTLIFLEQNNTEVSRLIGAEHPEAVIRRNIGSLSSKRSRPGREKGEVKQPAKKSKTVPSKATKKEVKKKPKKVMEFY